ncbi:MAG: Uma2 family endonuclease [Methylobacteriaceae bacterium]|nr:Uma2 family endonuclease [Methylobacteriaceae bacterium]
MSPEEFYVWGETQEDRYELVDGYPVPLHGMAGASRRHDGIVFNILVALGVRLRGRPCQGFTADTAVRTSAGRRRRPDAGVDCGERRDDAHEASEPRVVVEVLSPSTKAIDLLVKLDEYRAVPSLQEIVIVDPDAPQARLWFREAGGAWEARLVEELEASIELPSLGLALPLREIYEGIEFRPRPQAIA